MVAATEGIDKAWVRYKGSVIRVALENVRLATPEETLDTKYICDVLSDMQQELTGAVRPSGYEDLAEESGSPEPEASVASPPIGHDMSAPVVGDMPSETSVTPEPCTR